MLKWDLLKSAVVCIVELFVCGDESGTGSIMASDTVLLEEVQRKSIAVSFPIIK